MDARPSCWSGGPRVPLLQKVMPKDLRNRSVYKRDYYKRNRSRILKYMQANRERFNPLMRGRQLKKLYGMTREDFDRLLSKQGGKCAICKRPDNAAGRALGVDHCHRTGKIRGLLCNWCNAGLGGFRDNVAFLLSAVEYLKQ